MNKILFVVFFLLCLTGCGAGHEADPIYGVWRLTRVTGGFSGNGRPVTSGESLTLSPGKGAWRLADGRIQEFSYSFQTHNGLRVLVYNDAVVGLVEQAASPRNLTLADWRVGDGYIYELER